MRFYLVYRGQLSATQGKRGKRISERKLIRKQIAPQMKRLWETNPSLVKLSNDAVVPGPDNDEGYFGFVNSPFRGREAPLTENLPDGFVDLTQPIEKHGFRYRPLVRESLDLTCTLNVLFLRQEQPGALVKKAGDIDNRIKTFIDALEIPSDEPEGDEASGINYPLLENDSLVRGLKVDTERLLLPEKDYPNQVHLVVEVVVHVERVGEWNIALL
jgi:hypothetical protein